MKRSNHLAACFPNFSLAFRRLLRDDLAFRELCDDYKDATLALNFSLSPPGRSEKRAREYRGLIAELKAEIEATLHQESQKRPPRHATD